MPFSAHDFIVILLSLYYGDEESVKARFNSLVESLKGGRKRLMYTEKMAIFVDKAAFFVNDIERGNYFINICEYPYMICEYYSGMNYEYCNRADKRAISGSSLNFSSKNANCFIKILKTYQSIEGMGEYVTITPDLRLKAMIKVDGKERTADLSMGDYMAYIFLCWLQYVKFLQYIGEKCDEPLVIYGLTENLDFYFPIEDLLKEALSTGKEVYLFDTCENTEERFAKLDKLVDLVKV